MRSFVFTNKAKKRFEALPNPVQERIVNKLTEYKAVSKLPMRLLKDMNPATHRLRIGVYRLILKKQSATEFLVLDVGHRKDIYR